MTSSRFTNNKATKNGGALYLPSPTKITSSTFKNNIASKNGGAIYSTDSLNIIGGTSSGNNATYESGIYNTGILRLNNVILSSNYANVLSISLKAPSSVTKGDKIVVQSSIKTGDNLLNSIYSSNNNVIKNDASLATSNNVQGKIITLLLNDKKIYCNNFFKRNSYFHNSTIY